MVLPAPDGPTTTVMPRSSMVRSTPSRMVAPSISRPTERSSNSPAPSAAGAVRFASVRAVARQRRGPRRGARGRAGRGVAEGRSQPLAGRAELSDAPNPPPPHLSPLGVCAPFVAAAHLVDPPVAPGHLGGDLGLEAEAVLLDHDRLD